MKDKMNDTKWLFGDKHFAVGAKLRVGRSRKMDIPITKDALDVSGHHLNITLEDGAVFVENVGRHNISVNGKEISTGGSLRVSSLSVKIKIGVRAIIDATFIVAVNGFEIIRPIAVGGQSIVYEGVNFTDCDMDIAVGQHVALKVMNRSWPKFNHQFLQELVCRLSASSSGSNRIVRHFGLTSTMVGDMELPVVAMEMLDGFSCGELCVLKSKNEICSLSAACIIKEVAHALNECRGLGIVHRDIKPSNIFICNDGNVKLIDFTSSKSEDGWEFVPCPGRGIGTPKYRAPEIKNGTSQGDAQSDIYSLTLVFIELLTMWLPCQVTDEGTECCCDDDEMVVGNDYLDKRLDECEERLLGSRRVLKKGLSARSERYKVVDELISAIEDSLEVPACVCNGTRYAFLTRHGCTGCPSNGIAYGLIKNLESGKILKWKSFRRFGNCRYNTGELEAGRLSVFKGDFFRWGVEAAFLLDDKTTCLVYDKEFSIQSTNCDLKQPSLYDYEGFHTGRSARKLSISDAAIAFSRYASALAVLHNSGILQFGVDPCVLLYDPSCPKNAALSGHRSDKCCGSQAGPFPGGHINTTWHNSYVGWEKCFRSLYLPPDNKPCDSFGLGVCLYEAVTGKRAYELESNRGFVVSRGRFAIDYEDPVLKTFPRLAELICSMTKARSCNRLTDMKDIASALTEIDQSGLVRNKSRGKRFAILMSPIKRLIESFRRKKSHSYILDYHDGIMFSYGYKEWDWNSRSINGSSDRDFYSSGEDTFEMPQRTFVPIGVVGAFPIVDGVDRYQEMHDYVEEPNYDVT